MPRADATRTYRRWRWGQHLEAFVLDTRRYRSANDAPDDASKTMLGADQLAWLLDGLATSTATYCVVFSSVPLDFVGSVDTWESFTTERALVLAALDPARMIVVSGDQHYFAAQVHATGLREYVCPAIAAGPGSPPMPRPANVLTLIEGRGSIVLDLEPGPAPRLVVRGRDADGNEIFAEALG